MQVRIDFRFTELNKYINAERTNRYRAADIKSIETEVARLAFITVKPLSREMMPVELRFQWYCLDARRNPDNIAFAKKFVIDGMVKAGFLPNDGWKQIGRFGDEFHIADADYVVVDITSMSRYKANEE